MHLLATLPDQILYIVIWVIALIWIYSILRVAKDISWRTQQMGIQLISIITIVLFTPLLWLPLYFLIRPLHEEHDLPHIDIWQVICYGCDEYNDDSFTYCVFCGETLKISCTWCKQPVGVMYDYCPWCGDCMKQKAKKQKKNW